MWIWLLFNGCGGLGLEQTLTEIDDTNPTDEASGEPSSDEPSNEPSADPDSTDDDGDGVSENQGDCDDENPNVGPDEEEIPYDDLDNDCDPSTLDDDLDEDGYGIDEDCDDQDPQTHPGVLEDICDDFDNDCDGDFDEDGDPDIHEPFNDAAPLVLPELRNLNDTWFANAYLFPESDEDSFVFWFEDDADFCVFEDPDHFTCTIIAPSDASIAVDHLWREEGTSTFELRSTHNIPAGESVTVEGGGTCLVEDGGSYKFIVRSLGDASCLSDYFIECIKDGN